MMAKYNYSKLRGRNVEKYNYSKLRGRIVEKCGTISELVTQISISRMALQNKLAGKTEFSMQQALEIANVLDISKDEIIEYFYSVGDDNNE